MRCLSTPRELLSTASLLRYTFVAIYITYKYNTNKPLRPTYIMGYKNVSIESYYNTIIISHKNVLQFELTRDTNVFK